jgi:hypothetical protein
MIIDIHAHPGFLREISGNVERVAFRRKHFGLYKQSIWPLELCLRQLDAAGIDKAVLLPEDLTTRCGDTVVSNEEIRQLVDCHPDRFIGFASVDPWREDALDVLEHAFANLKLAGLKLNPASQRFFPNDARLQPIYEVCVQYNKPILFHSGMSWEPLAPAKYAQPLLFEDVALANPGLRFALAHFGWPWVQEVAMLVLKYPNVYADTALLYFDSPKEFFAYIFGSQLGSHWIDRSLSDKVMFGSNYPRIEQLRMRTAVESLDLRPATLAKILGGNAMSFLGIEEPAQ